MRQEKAEAIYVGDTTASSLFEKFLVEILLCFPAAVDAR